MRKRAIAQKGVGFVEQQHRIVALGLSKGLCNELFGFAHVAARDLSYGLSHQRTIDFGSKPRGIGRLSCARRPVQTKTSASGLTQTSGKFHQIQIGINESRIVINRQYGGYSRYRPKALCAQRSVDKADNLFFGHASFFKAHTLAARQSTAGARRGVCAKR